MGWKHIHIKRKWVIIFGVSNPNQTRAATNFGFQTVRVQFWSDKITFKNTICYSIGVTWVKQVQVWPSWWLKIMNVGFGLALLEIWLGFDRPISSHRSFIHTSIWTQSWLVEWMWHEGRVHPMSNQELELQLVEMATGLVKWVTTVSPLLLGQIWYCMWVSFLFFFPS